MSDPIVRAAQRLVDHWSRRPERSIAYTEAGERAKAMLIHAVRDHAEATRLAAPAAPSEPVPDGPRVWAMPELPEDVSAVRDRNGKRWTRCPDSHRWCYVSPAFAHSHVSDFDLLAHGPLTEVVEESAP